MISNNKDKYKLRHYSSVCKTSTVGSPLPMIMQLKHSKHSIRSVCRIIGVNYRSLRNYLQYGNIKYDTL